VQLDDGHHHGGATGVSTMSDHEATTKNGDSKVGDKKAKKKKKQFYSSCCDLVMKCSVQLGGNSLANSRVHVLVCMMQFEHSSLEAISNWLRSVLYLLVCCRLSGDLLKTERLHVKAGSERRWVSILCIPRRQSAFYCFVHY